jgi:hypothetical protein
VVVASLDENAPPVERALGQAERELPLCVRIEVDISESVLSV